MVSRENRKTWMFYPEDIFINYWNLFITLLLMVVCVYTPIEIAFADIGEHKIDVFSLVIDILFLIDMIIIFNCAYYDMIYDIIDTRKEIALNYLKGWFLIDLLAIVPFELIFNSVQQLNSLARLARFARLQKLIKLTRVLKIFKDQNRILKYVTQYLKIGLGFERLFFFVLVFFLTIHIGACLWLIVAALYHDDD